MHNKQVVLDMKALTAHCEEDKSRFRVCIESSSTTFVVLGRVFNVSMARSDEKKLVMLFLKLLGKEKLSVIVDGHCVIAEPAKHRVTRMIVLDRLPLFWAMSLRMFLWLKKEGCLPQAETSPALND